MKNRAVVMFKRMQAASNGDRPSRLSRQSTTMECLGNALFGQSPNAWYVCPAKTPPFKYREKLAVAVVSLLCTHSERVENNEGGSRHTRFYWEG